MKYPAWVYAFARHCYNMYMPDPKPAYPNAIETQNLLIEKLKIDYKLETPTAQTFKAGWDAAKQEKIFIPTTKGSMEI